MKELHVHCPVVMLLIGSFAGQYLLVHGPAWAVTLAVLQRECLVYVGIWCCAIFLIEAIQGARERADPREASRSNAEPESAGLPHHWSSYD